MRNLTPIVYVEYRRLLLDRTGEKVEEKRENSLTQPFYHIDPHFGVRKGKSGFLQINYITNMLMMTYRWQNMLKTRLEC